MKGLAIAGPARTSRTANVLKLAQLAGEAGGEEAIKKSMAGLCWLSWLGRTTEWLAGWSFRWLIHKMPTVHVGRAEAPTTTSTLRHTLQRVS